MYPYKKSTSTRLRERLADPIFLALLAGFIIFFFAYVTDFKISDLKDIQTSEPTTIQNSTTSEYEQYFSFINVNTTNLKTKFNELDKLLSKVNMESAEWRAQVEHVAEEINKLCDQGINTEAPDKYNYVHGTYVLALKKYKEAMGYVAPGPDNYIFSSDLGDAIELRKTGDKYLQQGLEDIDKLKQLK